MYLQYKDVIEACQDCATACERCATACLREKDPEAMIECIQLDRYCADICRLAAVFLARADENTRHVVQRLCDLCVELCEVCAAECRGHPMDHCQQCAAACDTCATACAQLSVEGRSP